MKQTRIRKKSLVNRNKMIYSEAPQLGVLAHIQSVLRDQPTLPESQFYPAPARIRPVRLQPNSVSCSPEGRYSAHSGLSVPVPPVPPWSSTPCTPVPTVPQWPQWPSAHSGPRGTVTLPSPGYQGSRGKVHTALPYWVLSGLGIWTGSG